MKPKKSYHFIGIGGTGMSGLAYLAAKGGATVSGSDRLVDRGQDGEIFQKMRSFGIKIYPQDGSGLKNSPDAVIASPAVESSNPDLALARKLGLRIMERAEFLISLTEGKKAMGIAGTSGKSTITAMLAHIMIQCGYDPTVVVGARMRDYETGDDPGNSRLGHSPWFCLEVDESDGWIEKYRCHTAVVSNIQKDHKEIDELKALFKSFLANVTDTVIVNADDPFLQEVIPKDKKVLTYGLRENAGFRPSNITLDRNGSAFTLHGHNFKIHQQGEHNLSNAVAAIAAANSLCIPMEDIAGSLETFSGLRMRMEIIGETHGITVIDDFAHNPSKIQAALEAASLMGKRRIVIYQPHGYGPTLFLRYELINAFSNTLSPDDYLFILDIYYAGGTAEKEITSDALVREIARSIPNTSRPSSRRELIWLIAGIAAEEDVIMVLGARDHSLSTLAKSIFEEIKSKNEPQRR